MAYTSGTANNYKDLLSILAAFAAANGWMILEQSETVIYLKGQGLDGLDEIYAGVGAFENTSSGYYNWSMYGSIAYRSGRSYSSHPNNSGGGAYAYLWNSPIPYWMVANARRIIVLAKVSTVYQLIHIGLIDPPATDAQYPYPLMISACGNTSTNRWSTTGGGNTMFCSGNGTTGKMRLHDGVWGNITSTSGSNVGDTFATFNSSMYNGAIISGYGDKYLLEQIYMVEGSRSSIAGAVNGLFKVSGYGQSSENIIVVDGVNHLVFQDVYRTGYGDYFAMRLV